MKNLTKMLNVSFSSNIIKTKFVNYKPGGPENMFLD